MAGSPQLMEAYRELVAARDECDLADEFYDGAVGESFASRRVRRLLRRSGAEDIEDFNYARVPVRVIAGRLRLLEPVPVRSGQAPDPRRDAAAIDAFHRIWVRNQLGAETTVHHFNTSRHGNGYLYVGVSGEKDDEVDILVHKANSVRVFYSSENPLRKSHAIHSWTETADDGPVIRANLYYPDHLEKWVTEAGKNPDNPDSWRRLPDEPDDIPNPSGVIPFFHFRNDRPYGTPEHLPAYGPQRMINKLIAAHGATIDFQMFPQRYYLADPAQHDPLENLVDPDYPEDTDDDPEGATESALEAHPAAVWKLYGRSAGQFEPARPEVFMSPMDRYIQAMAELCGIPRFHFVGTPDTPSGAALRTLDAPVVDIANTRKDAYSDPYEDAWQYALKLAGYEGYDVPAKWEPSAAVTDLEGWQIVQAKISAGVSPRQALVEAGYTPEQVDDWIDGADGSDLARRVAILVQIGTAVQALGAGAGLGVVDAPQVKGLIEQLLGQTEAGMVPAEPAPWPPPETPTPPPPAPLPAGGQL